MPRFVLPFAILVVACAAACSSSSDGEHEVTDGGDAASDSSAPFDSASPVDATRETETADTWRSPADGDCGETSAPAYLTPGCDGSVAPVCEACETPVWKGACGCSGVIVGYSCAPSEPWAYGGVGSGPWDEGKPCDPTDAGGE